MSDNKNLNWIVLSSFGLSWLVKDSTGKPVATVWRDDNSTYGMCKWPENRKDKIVYTLNRPTDEEILSLV